MSKRVKLLVGAGGALTLVAIIFAGLMATSTVLAQTPPAGGQTTDGAKNPIGLAQNFISKLAKNLGIDEGKLKDAVKTTETQLVDDGVAAGKITKDQGDKLKERIQNSQDGIAPFGLRGPIMPNLKGFAQRMRDHFGGMRVGQVAARQVVSDTAQILGMTPADVQNKLREGQSLVQIAEGKLTRDQLIQKLVDAESKRIDGNTKLTADQKTKLKNQLPNIIGKIVDMKFAGKKPNNSPGTNNAPAPQTPAQPQRIVPGRGSAGGSI